MVTLVPATDEDSNSDGEAGCITNKTNVFGLRQMMRVALDNRNPPRTGTTTAEAEVIDVNDNAPEFTHSDYLCTAIPDHPPFAPVAWVSVLDADSAPFDEVIFSIEDNNVLDLFDNKKQSRWKNRRSIYQATSRYYR